MISVAEAYEHYGDKIKTLDAEEIPVENALHRFLAEDIFSKTDLPPFPQSAMDGYALCAADTADASELNPVRFKLAGEVAARSLNEVPAIDPGTAVRIFTGGYVPTGADVVLPQEDAHVENGDLVLRNELQSGRHMRDQGEEILANSKIATAGSFTTTGILSALSIAGVDKVEVVRTPRIAILTTGDEIVKPGRELNPGEVYDANSVLITSWLRSHGYHDVVSTPVEDTLGGTVAAMQSALEHADVLLTCGGVSVGDKDFVIPAAEQLGFEQIFWRVRQRPGKPLYFGRRENKILLGIPGNPGSVFVCLNVHVLRALDRLSGAAIPRPHRQQGKLKQSAELGGQREFWMRCTTRISEDGALWLDELPRQSSHMITNLTDCVALARIPEGEGVLEEGSVVAWIPVEPFS